MVGLMGDTEFSARLNGYLSSHEWWIIVQNAEASKLIEDRYYLGDANDDFHIMVGEAQTLGLEQGIIYIAFAHKRWMSAEQLCHLVKCPMPGSGQDLLLWNTDDEQMAPAINVANALIKASKVVSN